MSNRYSTVGFAVGASFVGVAVVGPLLGLAVGVVGDNDGLLVGSSVGECVSGSQ